MNFKTNFVCFQLIFADVSSVWIETIVLQCRYGSVCLYHWCLLAELLPWHGEAGQGYGSELLIDCFSNSVNEIELGQASHSAGESHKTPFFCFWAHCASRLICALLILVKLFMLNVWVHKKKWLQVRAQCKGYFSSLWSSHTHSWWGGKSWCCKPSPWWSLQLIHSPTPVRFTLVARFCG